MSLASNQVSTAFLAGPAVPPQASGAIAGVRATDSGKISAIRSAPGVGVASCIIAAAGAAAVASRKKARARASTRIERCAFETELGVQSPVGFWDPVGFTADGDIAAFRRRRSVELKHGRICMLACMGYITPEIVGKWPGFCSFSSDLKFSDIPNGMGAISKVPLLGWAQIVAYFGFVEYSGGFEDYKTGTPGDYGWKPLTSSDPEKLTRKLQSEIANGRLAMIAIMGMLFQNGVVGDTGPLMWAGKPVGALRLDSTALRALPKAMEGTGGPFPDNVWDPAGLMNGKSEEQILYWRAVELKHGRTCMLATLGWIHVAAGWHPIGDAAARVRVSDDPLVNVQQLSMAGAWQVVFTIMCFEWLTAYICKPPAERPWDIFGWSSIIADETEQQWKDSQLRELNNGRLAMFAILGLIAGDAATGEYAGGFGKICFGMCDPAAWLGQVFPDTPFVMGPLYPMGPTM